MKKEEIHLFDLKRILLGNSPVEFLLEALIRSLLMYVILLIALRLMGKRMNGQITITEFAVMISLGAIVALPMQSPDRGLLPGIVLLMVIIALQRGINGWAAKNSALETLIQGKMHLLLKDGTLQLEEMKKAQISQEQLFAKLRTNDIDHLGQVERVYLEACGLFSVFTQKEPKPGLTVVPELDRELLKTLPPADHIQACQTCGNVAKQEQLPGHACPICQNKQWSEAVI